MIDLEENLDRLRHVIAFQELIDELENDWVALTQEVMTCDFDKVERNIGKMQAYRELLDMFRGNSA